MIGLTLETRPEPILAVGVARPSKTDLWSAGK